MKAFVALATAFALSALAAASCAQAWDPNEGTTVDGGADIDGGAELDGGADLDGGAELDGGGELDGGADLDGGPDLDGGAPLDGGALDGGGHDGGAADAGLADGGARDAGVVDAGVADAGLVDAGPPSCADGGVGGTRCGRTKVFESTSGDGPSAFDFGAGRSLYLSSEVSAVLGDFFVFSTELDATSPGANTELAFVSPSEAAASGGERGNFKRTGIEDLTALGGGISNPDVFNAIPATLQLHLATKSSTHRVLVREGHIYGLELGQGSDGGVRYGALYVDRIVTPAVDGGVQKQWVELRWLYQSTPGRRTFERPFDSP